MPGSAGCSRGLSGVTGKMSPTGVQHMLSANPAPAKQAG